MDAESIQDLIASLDTLPTAPAILVASHEPLLLDQMTRVYKLEDGVLQELARTGTGARAAHA